MPAHEERFEPGIAPPAGPGGAAYWLVFRKGELLLGPGTGLAAVPCAATPAALGLAAGRQHYLGTLDGRRCYAAEVQADAVVPAGLAPASLRATIMRGDELVSALAGRAWQILEWDRTHRFCGACGTPTEPHPQDRARQCPACGLLSYPRVTPVVMVLVTRGRELLLARKPGYVPGRYTVVTGFVEAGETLEHCMQRETLEEVGVRVKNPRYFGSQPWPFPHSLVLAYEAEYAGGELRADGVEIEDARWFDVDALPDLPEPVHVSRQLIDDTIARIRAR